MQELRTSDGPRTKGDEGHGAGPGSDESTLVVQERHLWLTLADMREADKHRFLDSPISPGRPIRRSGGGLCPAVLRRTEADGGVVSTHPAPAVRCCLHPTAGCSPSVCSSPRGALLLPPPPLQLGHNSSLHYGRSVELAAGRPGAARLRPCQAREAPGQAASLRRATRSLWILLFRRW